MALGSCCDPEPTMPKIIVLIALLLLTPPVLAQDGVTSDEIAVAQCLLRRLGFDPGATDGIFGSRTETAIRYFAEAYGADLVPGRLEAQLPVVVDHLITVYAERLAQPSASTSSRYHAALAGDDDAAIELGFMYLQGDEVEADPMHAYLWWIVAESTGTSRALNLKEWLRSSAKISDYDVVCAHRLVVHLH
jgi:peptidoglycan hydrolase-like protein with peptidoglycan-binding domain